MFFVTKRVSIVTGHYGSGKTNLAVNMALELAKSGKKTGIIDLDIVNPYFRTADFAGLFSENNIRLAAPLYAGTNLDIPALTPEIDALLSDETAAVIVDVGGDDAGAVALGRYAGLIGDMGYDMFYVVNQYRPETAEPEDSASLLREIETASRLRATGIINNSNLGTETSAADILASVPFADKVCQRTGLPLAATVVWEEKAAGAEAPRKYPVRIFVTKPWERGPF